MPERRATITERELERALADVGRQVDFPSAPDLTSRVRARLERPRPRRWPLHIWLSPRRWVMVSTLALLLMLLAVVAMTPPARDAVADWLGLRGVEIVPIPETSTSTVTPSGSPSTGTLLLDGRHVSLAEARGLMSFPILLPSESLVGQPDEVYVVDEPAGGWVTLLYRARSGLPEAHETGVGLLISQFATGLSPLVQKGLPAGTSMQIVSVGDARGYWIEGAPHVLMLRDIAGEDRRHPSRLAGNTLLWERNGITYRLESALSREDAIRIAESMR